MWTVSLTISVSVELLQTARRSVKMFNVPIKTVYDESTKIWRGSGSSLLFNPYISVGRVCLHMLNVNPSKVVQISERTGQQLTAGEMRLLAIRAAQHFERLGYTQDDVIGFVASNTHFLAPLALGALLHGVPFNALDPTFEKGDITHMFNITKPKSVFCDVSLYEKTKQALSEINLPSPIYVLNGTVKGAHSVEEFFKPTGNEFSYIPPTFHKGGDHVALVACSSGTTGLPKGICFSHCCLLIQLENILTSESVLLCFSTLYWFSGLFFLIIGTLCAGTRIISDRQYTPELMLELIEKYRVSHLFSPPSQMALALQCPDIKTRDLSSLTYYICGGSAVPVPVSTEMQKYLINGQILIGYGMSEIGGAVSVENKDMKRPGSVGQVALNIQIKIIDEDGGSLGIEEKGEVCIRTPYKNLGYYGITDPVTDNDGWVHSGDIGYFDADGFLYLVDRKKEILKYKGFQYSPTEIEMVIMKMPGVVEVCAFGIPDFIATDLPAAAIVKKDGSDLCKDGVYNYVAEQMADCKRLRGGVYFLPSLPKTASGKIQRRKVKEMIVSNADMID